MTNKILASVLCSGALLLTACGGGSSDSTNNQTKNESKEKLDYNKSETIDIINEPVVNLSNQSENLLLNIAILADGTYKQATAIDSKLPCISGTATVNTDNSVTLNNCKLMLNSTETIISVSGNIQSNTTVLGSSAKSEITLTNVNLDVADESVSVNGKLKYTYTIISDNLTQSLFESNQATYKFIDKTNNNSIYQYTLNNYALTSNFNASTGNIENIAKGQLNGEIGGKVFSVNFNSNFKFPTESDLYALKPNAAKVEIVDLYNQQNTISITQTIGGQALVSAYANAKLVQGYPKTVDWNEF
jgi:hypothetical protein